RDDDVYIFYFFFSSRRRHTRLQGDWSSDVCSSDLDEVIRLLGDDLVISMSILRHEEIDREIRSGYLSMARDRRRQMGEESDLAEIGRASCRERVEIWGGGESLNRKKDESCSIAICG